MGEIDYRGLLETLNAPAAAPPEDYGPLLAQQNALTSMQHQAAAGQEFMDAPLRPLKPGQPVNWPGVAGLALSTVLPAGGAALGRAVAPTLGRMAPVVGELAGNYAARKASVAIGAEEPGWQGDVASIAVPAAVRGYQALKNPVLRHLPGAGAALHQEGAERLAALPDTMQPATPSADLYAQVAQQNPMIRPSNIWTSASEVIQREGRLQPTMRNARVARVAEDLHQLVRDHHGQVPLQALQEHQQRLGLMVRQASAENWPEATALRRMYGAFYRDLDHAASQGVAGADVLRQANRAARQEFALEDLSTMFTPGHAGLATRPDGLVTVNGGRLRDTFEKRLAADELFRGSFAPEQLQAIRGTLRELEHLPRIPPGSGQTYGSGSTVVASGAVGTAVGALTQSPTLAAGAAALTPVANRLIGRALMSDTGRAWLLRTLATEGGLSPEMLGLISGGGRQAVEQGMTVEHTPVPAAAPE